jgi:hypothetical protein
MLARAVTLMLAQPTRTTLVTPHQAGVADNIGSDDCRQFALLTGHGNCLVFMKGMQKTPGRQAMK